MSDKTKLLPCPFCGGKAKVSIFPGAHNVWCENQPVKCGNRAMFTVEQWNTRAAPAEDARAVQDGPLTNEGTILQVAGPQQKRLLPSQAILPHPPRHEGFLQPEREVPGYTVEQMKEYGAQCVAAFIKQNKVNP